MCVLSMLYSGEDSLVDLVDFHELNSSELKLVSNILILTMDKSNLIMLLVVQVNYAPPFHINPVLS